MQNIKNLMTTIKFSKQFETVGINFEHAHREHDLQCIKPNMKQNISVRLCYNWGFLIAETQVFNQQ